MGKWFKFILVAGVLILTLSLFTSCKDADKSGNTDSGVDFYIRINDEYVNKEYIGYFFYLAQRNMLEEAGWKFGDDSNATPEDIERYWQTTDIDGKDAVFAARNIAADNAVRQKIQYYKSVEEGITITPEENAEIARQLESTIANNGGQEAFEKALKDMDTDMVSYRQIITENMYIRKLYDKYDSENKFAMSEDEFNEFSQQNANVYPPEQMQDAAKKYVFNDMVTQWEKEFDIEINDSAMNEFNV